MDQEPAAMKLRSSYITNSAKIAETGIEYRLNVMIERNNAFKEGIRSFPDKIDHVYALLSEAAEKGRGECRVRSCEFIDEKNSKAERFLVEAFMRYIDVPSKIDTATYCEKNGNEAQGIVKSWSDYALIFNWKDI